MRTAGRDERERVKRRSLGLGVAAQGVKRFRAAVVPLWDRLRWQTPKAAARNAKTGRGVPGLDGGEVRATIRTVLDTSCATAVILGQVVSTAILLATALYSGWCASHGLYPLSIIDWLLLLPFVGTIVTGGACGKRCALVRPDPGRTHGSSALR
jgi:hypothetical protein